MDAVSVDMRVVTVPDIGDFKDVPVIDVLVKVGDAIAKDQPVVALESDKAVMEVPSPASGVVQAIDVKVGDRISKGSVLLTLGGSAPPAIDRPLRDPTESSSVSTQRTRTEADSSVVSILDARVYAGPAVRHLARTLGVDLAEVKGSGTRGRILSADVHAHVKAALSQRAESAPLSAQQSGFAFALPSWPVVDHAAYGPVTSQPLSRIRKLSGANLHRNWIAIPHVTNHHDVDVTELEAFRVEANREYQSRGVKFTILPFVIKACVTALKQFPEFNASLDGDSLILKQYYHIGFAAETANGLVVPVIRDADSKGIAQLAQELALLAGKAREGKLTVQQMQGGTFSVSSLGGIAGSYFTPIINAPEVAILGLGRLQSRVAWRNGQAQPRLMLPLSLSWDHRVVDGAAAARFNAALESALGDIRRLLL